MIWLGLILLIIVIGVLYWLYTIGKKVKKGEAEFEKILIEANAKKKLSKYKRKSTPKVPSLKKTEI